MKCSLSCCFLPILVSYSVKGFLQKFMSETLGSSPDMPNQGGFSFVNSAEELANDLIQSLVIDVNVELDFAFGLDLNPLFDSNVANIWGRIPDPFIRMNQFDMHGAIGIRDWTANLNLGDVDFIVIDAKAMLNVSSTLSSSPLRITDPTEFIEVVIPPTDDSDRIIFKASLELDFPVLLIYDGIGASSRIGYL